MNKSATWQGKRGDGPSLHLPSPPLGEVCHRSGTDRSRSFHPGNARPRGRVKSGNWADNQTNAAKHLVLLSENACEENKMQIYTRSVGLKTPARNHHNPSCASHCGEGCVVISKFLFMLLSTFTFKTIAHITFATRKLQHLKATAKREGGCHPPPPACAGRPARGLGSR